MLERFKRMLGLSAPADPAQPKVRIVSAVGSTARPGDRVARGRAIERAFGQAAENYLAEIQAYNTALQPVDYVDEHGETVTGFVDPKRFKVVDQDELLRRKIAARTAVKKALSEQT